MGGKDGSVMNVNLLGTNVVPLRTDNRWHQVGDRSASPNFTCQCEAFADGTPLRLADLKVLPRLGSTWPGFLAPNMDLERLVIHGPDFESEF